MKSKYNFLYQIFSLQDGSAYKYSKSFINLEAVIDLEKQEGFKIPESIQDKFIEIKKKYDSFMAEIPLRVIEKFYYKDESELSKYIFICYDEKEIESIQIIELYMALEEFYKEVFSIASLIANYYNIEIKINNNATKNKYDTIESI